jgi:hypothetical protein
MVAGTQATKTWARVHQDEHRGVVLGLTEGGVLPLDFQDLLRACKSTQHMNDFVVQVQDLMKQLADWITARPESIDRAYFSFQSDACVLVVVRKAILFDPDFQDALSELELAIGQSDELNLVKLRTIALPNCSQESVATFIESTNACVCKP